MTFLFWNISYLYILTFNTFIYMVALIWYNLIGQFKLNGLVLYYILFFCFKLLWSLIIGFLQQRSLILRAALDLFNHCCYILCCILLACYLLWIFVLPDCAKKRVFHYVPKDVWSSLFSLLLGKSLLFRFLIRGHWLHLDWVGWLGDLLVGLVT